MATLIMSITQLVALSSPDYCARTSTRDCSTGWTRGELNSRLVHAMDVCYRYTTGPNEYSGILTFLCELWQMGSAE